MRLRMWNVTLIFLLGCSEPVVDTQYVDAQCKQWEGQSCRACATGETDDFRNCYYDSSKMTVPEVVREDCIAVHVGRRCQPCESIFALNYGGALQEVDCKEFYTAIEKRNKKCGNCVKLSTDLD